MVKPIEHSPQLQALLNGDRVDLAARLLVSAFGPIVDDPYPYLTCARLGESLASSAGVKVSSWSWSIRRSPDAHISRVVLELVLMWERAGLACRGLAIDANEVVLLHRGERILRTGNVDAVRRALLA